MLNEKTIVSGVTLITSLVAYFYAREVQKDAVPYVMVGGFFGALLGETIAGLTLKDKDKNNKK